MLALQEALGEYQRSKAAGRRRKAGKLKKSIPAATPMDAGSPLRVTLQTTDGEAVGEGVLKAGVGSAIGAAAGGNAMDEMRDADDGENRTGEEHGERSLMVAEAA